MNSEFKGKTPFVGLIQIKSPRLMVLEPELVRDVMVRNFKNFHDNEFGDVFDKDTDPLFGRNPIMLKVKNQMKLEKFWLEFFLNNKFVNREKNGRKNVLKSLRRSVHSQSPQSSLSHN